MQTSLQGAEPDRFAPLIYGFADGVDHADDANGILASSNECGTLALDTATGAHEFTATAARLDGLRAGQDIPAGLAFEVHDKHGAAPAPAALECPDVRLVPPGAPGTYPSREEEAGSDMRVGDAWQARAATHSLLR